MAVDKEDRKAYENGNKEADYIRDHPVSYFFTGGIHSRPSDPSNASAYNKGMRREQLDDDKGSGGGDGGSSSGCFITTACVVAKGLPDNCEELTLLRAFRDNYVGKLPGGSAILDEYYKIAPEIVESINLDPDSAAIYNRIFNAVQDACELVRNHRYEEAFSLYSATVINLKAEFC